MEQSLYEGYLWYSDQTKPQVLKAEPFSIESLNNLTNPFVVEGQLWCKESRESISIKYVDGEYKTNITIVPEDDLMKEKSGFFTKKKYIPHRIKGVDKLVFLQYWRVEKDLRCNNFDTLIPDKLVFVGFE